MSDLDEFMDQIGNMPQSGKRGGDLPAAAEASAHWAQQLAAASCWAQSGNAFFPVTEVVDTVPAGAFRCCLSDRGPYLEKMPVNIDNLLKLPDSATERLLAEFVQFWKLRAAFDKRGFTFKRGLLMWGPPGSGKTSAVWQMTERLIKDQGGIVIFIENPQVAVLCLNTLRRIEPKRPVITVMEDIDTIIQHHGEHLLLAILDGEFQTNNVVHLATTNYPHLLDRRFVDRPSRFDTIMKIGMPSAAARRVYFSTKEPDIDQETSERWVERTEDYSIAHLREVCIAIKCFEQSEEAVFDRLDKMKQKINVNSDGDEMSPTGFVPLSRLREKTRHR
jgi:hypothetical protein